jgi:hypothetical protein
MTSFEFQTPLTSFQPPPLHPQGSYFFNPPLQNPPLFAPNARNNVNSINPLRQLK